MTGTVATLPVPWGLRRDFRVDGSGIVVDQMLGAPLTQLFEVPAVNAALAAAPLPLSFELKKDRFRVFDNPRDHETRADGAAIDALVSAMFSAMDPGWKRSWAAATAGRLAGCEPTWAERDPGDGDEDAKARLHLQDLDDLAGTLTISGRAPLRVELRLAVPPRAGLVFVEPAAGFFAELFDPHHARDDEVDRAYQVGGTRDVEQLREITPFLRHQLRFDSAPFTLRLNERELHAVTRVDKPAAFAWLETLCAVWRYVVETRLGLDRELILPRYFPV